MHEEERDVTAALSRLTDIVKKLRSPQGCSWDREQTVRSLSPFMLEEAYEVADAISSGDMELLRKELGDLLLHVVMSTLICQEQGLFTLSEVMDGISEKLIRRHPHVFQDDTPSLSPREVERQWEAIKASEKRDEGFFGSIPMSMPALQTAWRVQQRASEVGFDWPEAEGAREKIFEELEEFERALESDDLQKQENELGDMLFSFVNYCRMLGFKPESALRSSNRKFMERFARMEDILKQSGTSLEEVDLETMDGAWEMAKRELKG
jgi:MazG family protein